MRAIWLLVLVGASQALGQGDAPRAPSLYRDPHAAQCRMPSYRVYRACVAAERTAAGMHLNVADDTCQAAMERARTLCASGEWEGVPSGSSGDRCDELMAAAYSHAVLSACTAKASTGPDRSPGPSTACLVMQQLTEEWVFSDAAALRRPAMSHPSFR